ncbi:MAG TPA: hypothetical protein PLQ61_04600 [Bacteroidales bacterium]|nr:hypothetical protein [Bacteroidales bacterium]
MTRPDWNIFKAKFSENPQTDFEWMCYILFCKEFNKYQGIFRYKNQSSIETNPIQKDNKLIGWQAKFFDSTLSKHKKEILEAVENVKRNYPQITTLIFYTNQEWGQHKGEKPKSLIEIEGKARDLYLEIDWRTASFFESPFVCVDNEIIIKHFFSLDKSIFSSIEEQQQHTENILKEIKTSFIFNGQTFRIERSNIIAQLRDSSSQVTILSGIAGIGKTVIIKKYYEELCKTIPFYVFKASEFNNLRTINEFFKDISFYEFINAHNEDIAKIIVIDSAERILDIENTDPLKEFLSKLIERKWKIIFTIRTNFVEDLNIQFLDIYDIAPLNIEVTGLNDNDLYTFSRTYFFTLPSDEKLLELLKNPFYLNEYLRFTINERISYTDFKNQLWHKIIKKSQPQREQCFLIIAFQRASSGQFYVSSNCESAILNDLIMDGVIAYETPGYFITQDIYEEWALEKIIEIEYSKKHLLQEFFDNIGESLPIRRSLRNWVSEKLLLKDNEIKRFIEESIKCNDIKPFWKDEILISVLLSDYSESFFQIFKEELLKDNQTFLKKLTFLLRLACKDIDSDFLQKLGLINLNELQLQYVMTKPKGLGWNCLIKFIYDNIQSIKIENIGFILPLIHDWNSKFREGDTTRVSSLIACKYYQWIIEKNVFISQDDSKQKLLQTIIFGTSEIVEELINIFEKVLKNKWKFYRDPFYDLVETVLTSFDGINVCRVLPEYVLKLADLYWTYSPNKEGKFYDSEINVEKYFGLEEIHNEYYPASAFQTPIFQLLHYSFRKTIDFILNFVNKCIVHYANSGFDKSVYKTKLYIDDNKVKEQYISHCLWNIYRGTSSPVSPYLLQSIHMALEKFLLEKGKSLNSEELESWLKYLLENSESASISAVVTSIVLAYPEKTFNAAKILFRTKDFIVHDKTRLSSEFHIKSLYSIGYGLNYNYKIYEDERIKTCDDAHRKWSLEELFFNYQLFRSTEISEDETLNRQKVLWKILDEYYDQLPDKSHETEEDKTWRLFLSRMDRRKMDIKTEVSDKGILFQFNPDIDPELKEYREKSLAKISEPMKYCSLKLWASLKMKNDETYKDYKNYEENPAFALKDVREIIKKLNRSNSYDFYLYNSSIPSEVCSVLIRDHINILSQKDKEFCKKVIIEAASSSFKANYQYQISDGVESSISVLPILFKEFHNERATIKTVLLITLFDPNSIGAYAMFSDFPTNALIELYNISFDDAQSILFGFLSLKPGYEKLRDKIHKENQERNIHQTQESEIIERFFQEYASELQNVIDNKISYEDLGEVRIIDINILSRAFRLIPLKTNNEIHKKIVKDIIASSLPKILSDEKEDRIDYAVKHGLLRTYTSFVLNRPREEVEDYLKPLIDNFNISRTTAELLQEFILAEDKLNTYDNFWLVWNCIKEKVFEICRDGDGFWYVDDIIKSYLFAQTPWKETAKEWHSFKDPNKNFFEELSAKIGHCTSTLYSISKLLNGIGTAYINDGVFWISNILERNQYLTNQKLEVNTIYYIESFIRKYINNNQQKIKRTNELKEKVLLILNFLIDKGSVVAFMLRERVL